MDAKIAEQILDELAPTFEGIESRSEAILHFLKDKGIATDEELAPYLEQAAAASSVRWRALRVRMGRLFALAEKSEEEHLARQLAKEAHREDAPSEKAKPAKAETQQNEVDPAKQKKDEQRAEATAESVHTDDRKHDKKDDLARGHANSQPTFSPDHPKDAEEVAPAESEAGKNQPAQSQTSATPSNNAA